MPIVESTKQLSLSWHAEFILGGFRVSPHDGSDCGCDHINAEADRKYPSTYIVVFSQAPDQWLNPAGLAIHDADQ